MAKIEQRRVLTDAELLTRQGRRKHGEARTYAAGCRCDTCREGNTSRHKTLIGKPPPAHGTVSAYTNYGCRCEKCKAAGVARNAMVLAKIKEGKWNVAHGSVGQYTAGCRCDECMAGYADRLERSRKANAESRSTASKAGQQWTSRELELVVQDDGIGLRAKAKELGRSLSSVTRARYRAKHGRDDQQESLAGGVPPRKGQQYTGTELELISRKDLTTRQLAKMLGRTHAGIRSIRRRLLVEPKLIRLAGVSEK